MLASDCRAGLCDSVIAGGEDAALEEDTDPRGLSERVNSGKLVADSSLLSSSSG